MKTLMKTIALMGIISVGGSAFAAEPLVDVEWIKANACNDGVRVLDIRNGIDGGSRTAYLRTLLLQE